MVLKERRHRECIFGMDFEVQLAFYKEEVTEERGTSEMNIERLFFCFVLSLSSIWRMINQI